MPGRQGKQRTKKKKSKRVATTEMERTLKDSVHGRKRKERDILKNLIPPKLLPKVNKVVVSPNLPMFRAATTAKASPTKKK